MEVSRILVIWSLMSARSRGMRCFQVYLICEAIEDSDMLIALSLPGGLLLLSAVYAFKVRRTLHFAY